MWMVAAGFVLAGLVVHRVRRARGIERARAGGQAAARAQRARRTEDSDEQGAARELIARAIAARLVEERAQPGAAGGSAQEYARRLAEVEFQVRRRYVLADRVPPPNLLELVEAALEEHSGDRAAVRSTRSAQ